MKKLIILSIAALTIFGVMGCQKKPVTPPPTPPAMMEEVEGDVTTSTATLTITEEGMTDTESTTATLEILPEDGE